MNRSAQKQQKDLKVLEQIAKSNPFINALAKETQIQISLPFGVDGRDVDVLENLKLKIAKICYEHGEQWRDYIRLPKFTKINASSREALQKIIQSIWNEFLTQKDSYQLGNEFLPNMQKEINLQKMEEYHLNNFYFLMNYHQNPMARLPIINLQPNQEFFIPNIQNNFLPQNNYIVPQNYSQPPQPAFSQPNIAKIEEPMKNQKKSPYIRKNREPVSPIPGNSKLFVGCVCRGKISAEERHFECNLCNKKYHLSCFQIPTNAKDKETKKICPLCKIKDENANIFYNLIGQPLQCLWVQYKDLLSKKITIKGKKCKQIVENHYNVHIRIRAIKGESYYTFETPMMKDQKQPLMEIKLQNDYLIKEKWDDAKITLELPQSEEEEQKKPQILFLAVCVVKKITEEEVLEKIRENEENTGEEQLKTYFYDKKQLKICVRNMSGNVMRLPGRGIDCQHFEVMDIDEYVKMVFKKNEQIPCFVCKRRCRSLVIDTSIQKEIRAKGQVKSQWLYYSVDGKFAWKQG